MSSSSNIMLIHFLLYIYMYICIYDTLTFNTTQITPQKMKQEQFLFFVCISNICWKSSGLSFQHNANFS